MPAPIYNLINDFIVNPIKDNESISVDPYWIVYVVSLKDPLTFSRKDKKSKSSLDYSDSTRSDRLLITSDCLNLTIGNAKSSHTKSLSATLIESDTNYLAAILPGDWIAAWMVNSKDDYNRVVAQIRDNKKANSFGDGLKFLGRVDSIRKQLQIDGGIKRVEYQLSAFGFKELDSMIFYDIKLAESSVLSKSLPDVLAKIGLEINDIMRVNSKKELEDNVHVYIPRLFELLLGKGAKKTLNNDLIPALSGLVEQDTGEAPGAYTVPNYIGQILEKNKTSKKFDLLAFSDIMELVTGVQKYENFSQKTDLGINLQMASTNGTAMNPTIKELFGHTKYTGEPMLGAFLLNPLNICNQPVWNVLSQYLNPAINEMFTCMRANQDGDIVPTIVVRQKPFTTPVFAKLNSDKIGQKDDVEPVASLGDTTSVKSNQIMQGNVKLPVTEFHNLPRWSIDKTLVKFYNIGRSDTTRVNFVHVYGMEGQMTADAQWDTSKQLALNPPITDNLDISRNGLRTYMDTTSCLPINQAGKVPSQWMALIADRLIGSQLTLNGHISLVGIQAPICEGDNVQFGEDIFHIESVTHSCSINPANGTKSFGTSLTLTNGVKAGNSDSEFSDTDISKSFYSGLLSTDNTENDPGKVVDIDQPKLKDSSYESDPAMQEQRTDSLTRNGPNVGGAKINIKE